MKDLAQEIPDVELLLTLEPEELAAKLLLCCASASKAATGQSIWEIA